MRKPQKYLTDDECTRAVATYQGGRNVRQVALAFDVAPSAIVRLLRLRGIELRPTNYGAGKLRNVTRAALVEMYERLRSVKAVAGELKVDHNSAKRALVRFGVPLLEHREACRKVDLDEGVFDEPSEEGRYWIGFLMADGAVVKDRRHDSWTVSLDLSSCDAAHVVGFASFLKTRATILSRPGSRSKLTTGHEIETRPHTRVAVTSKRLAESLARFGVMPKKSATAKCVGLESCPHFWRGAVDGDGFLSWHKTKGRAIPLVGFCGSESLVAQFREFCVSAVGELRARVRKVGSTLFNIRIAGTPAVAIIRALYETEGRALPRKAALAREMMDWTSRYPARSLRSA